MDDQRTERENGGRFSALSALLLVCAATASQAVLGFLFYRFVDAPDYVVIFLSAIIGIVVYTLIIRAAMPARWSPIKKYAAACSLSVVLGIVAEMVALTVAFNMYGT
jgi:hypothetical protein